MRLCYRYGCHSPRILSGYRYRLCGSRSKNLEPDGGPLSEIWIRRNHESLEANERNFKQSLRFAATKGAIEWCWGAFGKMIGANAGFRVARLRTMPPIEFMYNSIVKERDC